MNNIKRIVVVMIRRDVLVRCLVAVVSCCIHFGLATSENPGFAQNSVNFADVEQHWKDKEKTFKSARIHWNERRFEAADPPSKSKPFSFGPDQDTEYECAREFVFRGDSFRFSSVGKELLAGEGLKNSKRINIWRGLGIEDTEFNVIEEHSVGIRSASNTANYDFLKEVDLIPLALAFCPVKSGILPSMMVKEEGVIDGQLCLIAQESRQGVGTEYAWTSIWIDPSNGYAVRRLTLTRGGSIVQQIDIKYSHKTETIYGPTEWTVIAFAEGKRISSQIRASVSDLRVNESVPDSEFSFVFPVGTYVRDQIDKEEFYIVKEGGKRNILNQREWVLGASFGKPRAPLKRPQNEVFGTRHNYLIICMLLMIVVVLLYLIRSRRLNERNSIT